uniref:LAGLIDADG endonuclease n=1 Tax=Sphaerobolus stellatus TaxID=68786 RepID=A0A7D4ZF23_9AGAM|nr:LAGLIDADG endonuclease [Sphaerobolus stellatus]
MRTPKIEALHRMIRWFNLKYDYKIPLLDLDHSLLNSNSWLSGFIDADGSFYLNWLYDKKGKATSLQYYMRISQRQVYHRGNAPYFSIMSNISNFFSVPLRSRERKRNNYVEKSYEVRTGSYISNYILLSYLINYPLFSYKFRAVPVQIELLQMSISKEYKLDSGLAKLLSLKEKQNFKSNLELGAYSYDKDHLDHILKNFPF